MPFPSPKVVRQYMMILMPSFLLWHDIIQENEGVRTSIRYVRSVRKIGNSNPAMRVVSMYEIHFGGETVSLLPL